MEIDGEIVDSNSIAYSDVSLRVVFNSRFTSESELNTTRTNF